ncbi:glutamate receptor ionotropic, kainate 2 isoform X15 [Nilaparvata lugens]|uniref:glutamate receptor ionotropic, kainate 2 isoform X15 n=1 Tax=Nilaparvata lugens TaxID=108931 RepID=UPI00193CD03F|nr:glutamate receptor ionotropic, kainate 2 isoform X15 [Nilaparvata lugens]
MPVTKCRHIFFLTLLTFTLTTALPPIIKIGAIFTQEEKDSSTELAFKYAVYRINRDKTLLPKTTLVYDIQYVPKDDSFHASKKACQQVQDGVQAVFGPSDPLLGAHIHSICDALDIPHLESRLDLDSEYKEFSINLHPAQTLLNNAFYDVIDFLNWTRVAIIYEEDYGLIKLRELVRSPGQREVEIHIRQADPDSYRSVLKEVKTKEIHNLIVDTRPENMHHFLRGILQLQMNDYKYHYLFTSFDIETFDLEDFKYNFVNMTAFRMVDAEDVNVRQVLEDMQRFQPTGHSPLNKTSVIQAGPALMYDSVLVFAVGLQTLEQSHSLVPANVSCDAEMPWDGGLSLINYINSVELKGLSGPIEFKEGRRIQFKLDLLKLKQHSLVKVGEWSPATGVNISDRAAFFDSGSMNVTLVVITILEIPYVMMRYGKNYTGNSRFYGFCVDLLERVSKEVGFDYILDLVPDKKYGAQDPGTGEWNGMVLQLMKHKADLAVGSMTINYARESVIDFTKPFMNLGISILFKATSTRIVGGIWWFFTLIIISSYTANLAAFLTVERMITPIENAEDLAGQTDISYGTLDSGSTMTFFRDSMIETYKKMWRFMENKKPSVFVPTYEEGIRRVLEGNYAFLMESTMLDYIVQRDCNLTQIGGLLDSKGYGIATPMGSPWRDKISLAILELQEKGEIQMLYDKWWKNPGDTCTRNEKGKESKANALGVDNIGGVFVVLLCGLAIAVIVAIFEFCYNSKKITKLERRVASAPHQSLCAEMLEELCFALRCRGSRQRPALKRQCSKCLPGTTYVPATFDLPPPVNNGLRSQRSSMAVSLEVPPDLHGHTPSCDLDHRP